MFTLHAELFDFLPYFLHGSFELTWNYSLQFTGRSPVSASFYLMKSLFSGVRSLLPLLWTFRVSSVITLLPIYFLPDLSNSLWPNLSSGGPVLIKSPTWCKKHVKYLLLIKKITIVSKAFRCPLPDFKLLFNPRFFLIILTQHRPSWPNLHLCSESCCHSPLHVHFFTSPRPQVN